MFSHLTIEKIIWVNTTVFERPQQTRMTNRPSFGLSIAIDGEIAYHQNGKTFISDRQHVIFFPQGGNYLLDCYQPGRFTLVNFTCAPAFRLDEFLRLEITDAESYLQMHRAMERAEILGPAACQMERMSLLYGMLARLAQEGPRRHISPLFKPLIPFLEAHLQEPALSNGEMARQVGLSEPYFRKLFLKSYGISPWQYLMQLRLRKARQLLENSGLPLDEVAAACGYSNFYYFLKVFKAQTGYTPTEYRNRYQNRAL